MSTTQQERLNENPSKIEEFLSTTEVVILIQEGKGDFICSPLDELKTGLLRESTFIFRDNRNGAVYTFNDARRYYIAEDRFGGEIKDNSHLPETISSNQELCNPANKMIPVPERNPKLKGSMPILADSTLYVKRERGFYLVRRTPDEIDVDDVNYLYACE
jgi:hypothetical protein